MNISKRKTKIIALVTAAILMLSQIVTTGNVFAEAEKDLTEQGYIGVNAGSDVPESFTNDLWLQYDFKEISSGETVKLVPRRVEEAITNEISNNVELPEFNYEIIQGDSIRINEKNNAEALVTGVKKGVSIVKVTYDELKHKEGKIFPATDPVNTAYVIYSVNPDKNITIKDNIVYEAPGKDEILFRSYDTVYFAEGDYAEFPLKVTQTGAEKLEVFCNGLPVRKSNGKYILPLENRSNIIEMRGTAEDGSTRSFFRVLDARKIEINIKNLTNPGKEFYTGDKAEVSFRGITMPVYKLATIYNPRFGQGATHVSYTDNHNGKHRGICEQYDLATNNSFTVELEEKGTYHFEDGKIYSGWWGDELGSDKVKDKAGEPNLNAKEYEGVFSIMPDFEINVKYSSEHDKEAAKSELESYIDLKKYRPEQRKEIKTILHQAEEKLEKADSEEEINKIVSETKAQLDKVVTDERLSEEEKIAEKLDHDIESIGKVTLESKAEIEEARKVYNDLSSEGKKFVKNISILEDAEKKLAELMKKADLGNSKVTLGHKDFIKVKGGYKITSTGKHINAKVTVNDSEGSKLKEGRDYTVKYSKDKRVRPGKYKITVKGKGNYTGEKSITFFITPKAPTGVKARLSKLKGGYDDAVISWNKSEGASGYSVSYRSKGKKDWTYLGRTTKTKIVKEDLYDGRTYEFKIKPYYKYDGTRYMSTESETTEVTTLKKVKLKAVKKVNSSKVNVKWDNIKGERGYEISRSAKKSGTNIVYTFKTTSGNNKTISAKAGKGYYYKVRAYQIADGEKITAPWSDLKYYKSR